MDIPVTKSSLPPFEEYIEEIKDIWDTHWLTNMGFKHEKLQRLLEQKLNVPRVVLYTNGHLALENIIAAFNFPAGSEIITTPFTFASTTHAIVRNSLNPVFCDIDPRTMCMDPDRIEELITEKTVAILPVHVYGTVCDIERIQEIAERHDIKVIYDAAHTFGEKYKGKAVAWYGHASMISFHATKVFHTIEGGCAIFKDDRLRTVLEDLKNFGIRGPEEVRYVGGNAKMNEFQAAMGICNLRHIDAEVEKRKHVSDIYIESLSDTRGIQLKVEQENVLSNYAYFPVIFDGFRKTRDQVFAELASEGIFARKYFFPVVQDYHCYRDRYNSSITPVAKKAADNVLCLPIYPDLSDSDVMKICSILLK